MRLKLLLSCVLCPACGFGLDPKVEPGSGVGDDSAPPPDDSPGTDDSDPVEPADLRPIADAGPDQAVEVDAVVHLDGSASSDPEGADLTWAWDIEDLPSGSGVSLVNPTHANPMFVPDLSGTYRLRLVVDDGGQQSAPDTVEVTAQAVGDLPIANAGNPQAVTVGDTVHLDGSLSWDPQGDALNFTWTLASVPSGSAAVLSGATTATPTFVADVAGRYETRLVVDDGVSSSAPDAVTITASEDSGGSDCGFGCAGEAGAILRRRLGGQALLFLGPLLVWRRRRLG